MLNKRWFSKIRRLPALIVVIAVGALALMASGWLHFISKEINDVQSEVKGAQRELEMLGEPMPSQTVPQIGDMSLPTFATSPQHTDNDVPKSIQIDLGSPQVVDAIAMIPVQMDWRQLFHPTFRFPSCFVVELSVQPDFRESFSVGDFRKTNCPHPGTSPVMLKGGHRSARYVRVSVYDEEAFALAEIMVMSGRRNIAIDCPVDVTGDYADTPPRWDAKNLVDGRTPLGPPILNAESPYDGFYAGPNSDSSPAWIALDLLTEHPIQEIRLFPVHGRYGIDLPGYHFPSRFQVEVSNEPTFPAPIVVTSRKNFPNPGNNVVTIAARGIVGRYVRVLLPASVPREQQRLGFAEIEVYANNNNAARTATTYSSGDPHDKRKDWPMNRLTDGFTNFGKIIELPEWLNNWVRRAELEKRMKSLHAQENILLTEKSHRQWLLTGALLPIVIGTVVGAGLWMRMIRNREIRRFQQTMIQDLHDEVGSTIAAIGMISEAAQEPHLNIGGDAWSKVSQFSREATRALRETLWLAGGTEDSRLDLMAHLKATSQRMLPNLEVEWTRELSEFPGNFGPESRKQIFLFFKESLANIVRHSGATKVVFSASVEHGQFVLIIHDDGCGFSQETSRKGIGLQSLRDRAGRVGGSCNIVSEPSKGTRIELRVKLP